MSQSGSLVTHLKERYHSTYGHKASDPEARSWDASLAQLARDLDDAGLGDIEFLAEYPLPLSSLRADVVLAGTHPTSGSVSYVVVELKQWDSAQVVPDAPDVCTVPHAPSMHMLHPVKQVQRYCSYLVDFVRALENHPDAVVGVAYLHNAEDRDVRSLTGVHDDDHGRLFTKTTRGAFLSYLQSRLAPSSGSHAADKLVDSKVSPSRQLIAVAADEIKNREQFTLLDQQQVAYSLVLAAVRKAQEADHKEVIVVTGGPGSGKSVIALSVLGELYRRGHTALHATGSKSFTTTLRKTAGKGTTRVQKLFQYFNSFMHANRNNLDVLLCDEAHRIRETSNNRFTAKAKRSDKRQIDELLDAARVPVFLLDEHQVVRPGELGTVEEIEQSAQARNLTVRHVSLDGQFRCGGSRQYEQWVLDLLQLNAGSPTSWTGDPRFELQVADTPAELEKLLASKADDGYGARMTAGFCWPWSDPTSDGKLIDDIVIDDWRRPWNVKGERSVNGAPSSPLWATDPAGFGQVGCIYTAQGFEYDWNGVIFGPDLVWRTDRWVADRSASKDTVVARSDANDYDRLIRNTYKVLLTRGMVGTVLYSTDAETRDKLRQLIHG